jgi:type II secretory pathway component PulM
MIAKMTPEQRRMLAIGLAVLAVVLTIAVIVAPALERHRHYDRALSDYRDQLARHLRIAATRESTEAKLSALKAKQPQRDFLKNPNPTVAASELQDLVRTAIESSGARQISISVPPHKDEGRYRQITVNVNVTATGPALRRLLHGLETKQPRLLIENFTARQSVGTNFRPAPGNEPEMFVQFDVVGFALGGGA